MITVCNSKRKPLFFTWQYTGLKRTHTVEDGRKSIDFTYTYARGLETGTSQYTYTVSCTETGDRQTFRNTRETTTGNAPIRPEYRLYYDGEFYVVKSVQGDRVNGFRIFAEYDLDGLSGYHFPTITTTGRTVYQAAQDMLDDYYALYPSTTPWTVLTPNQAGDLATKTRDYTAADITPIDYIDKLCSVYLCEPVFDTQQRTITFYSKVGEDKGVYFRKGLNLTKLDKKTDSYDLYTMIKPIGADGATLDPAQFPGGYVTNFSYTEEEISYIWEDENYTDMSAMAADAAAMLADMCKPIVSYSCSIRDLASQYPDDYDYLSYHAGDTVQIVDADSDSYDKQRIVKTIEYPLTPEKNSVEMANTMLTFEELQKKLKDAADRVQNTISSDGKISYRKIRGLEDNTVLENTENVLRLQSTGLNRQQRVNQLNTVLRMQDTSGTLDEQITRAADALSLNASASTGSDVLDDYENRISTLEAFKEEIETVSIRLQPYETVERSLYNVATGETYGDSAAYSHQKFHVTPGQTYIITGTCASNTVCYPAVAFFKSSRAYRLSLAGDTANTTYTDLEVTAPAEAEFMVVNSNLSTVTIKAATTESLPDAVSDLATMSETVAEIQSEFSDVQTRVENAFAPASVDAVIYQSLRNPFKYKEFEKGKISFVFDDLRSQQDSIASIFEMYSMPLCLAAIPSRMGVVANGLEQARGTFTPGMYMFEVVQHVVQNGGETLAHNSVVLNRNNQYDYKTMYSYFFETRANLEYWLSRTGPIRGLIRAGGSDQINSSKEIERWLYATYEYSDMGNHSEMECYYLNRVNINQPLADIKQLIDDCEANKTWLRFYGHDYDYGGGTTLASEQDLMDILDYVQSKNVDVVTFATMYDDYGSTRAEEELKALIKSYHP